MYQFKALSQVNVHDSAHKEQGYLTYKDRWLLLLVDIDLAELQDLVINITHVTTYALNASISSGIEVCRA